MIIIKLQAQADSWARERMHNNEIFCTWERADKTVTLQEQNIKEYDNAVSHIQRGRKEWQWYANNNNMLSNNNAK
jgi:hypothetical protein